MVFVRRIIRSSARVKITRMFQCRNSMFYAYSNIAWLPPCDCIASHVLNTPEREPLAYILMVKHKPSTLYQIYCVFNKNMQIRRYLQHSAFFGKEHGAFPKWWML